MSTIVNQAAREDFISIRYGITLFDTDIKQERY